MAANFEVFVARNGDTPLLKLTGDFDATSAYELIYAIKKLPAGSRKISVHIQTDGLKQVHRFGLDVFERYLRSLNGYCPRLVFTGHNASLFFPKDACMTV